MYFTVGSAWSGCENGCGYFWNCHTGRLGGRRGGEALPPLSKGPFSQRNIDVWFDYVYRDGWWQHLSLLSNSGSAVHSLPTHTYSPPQPLLSCDWLSNITMATMAGFSYSLDEQSAYFTPAQRARFFYVPSFCAEGSCCNNTSAIWQAVTLWWGPSGSCLC